MNETISKAGQALSFIQHNIRTSKQYLKEIAYFTYVGPILEYACAVWDLVQKVLISWKRSRIVLCGIS